MKKKVQSKNQTKELSRAKWEFQRRNPKAWEEYNQSEVNQFFREYYEKCQKRAAELLSRPEIKQYCEQSGISPFGTEDYDEFSSTTMQRPAAVGLYHFIDFFLPFFAKCPWEKMTGDKTFEEETNERWMLYLINNARLIFSELTHREPFNTLLVGIDLRRSKEVIMAEVEAFVENYQKLYRGKEPTERLKWLSIADELLEVWDLYDKAGQKPWQKTFRQISRKVGRPLSTVKDQWYKAYEKIHGKRYDPESKYTTEEKRGDATELCSKCPHGAVCYKKSGDWIPCQDYLRIAGKETNFKLIEYRDDILYDDNMKNRKKQKYSE